MDKRKLLLCGYCVPVAFLALYADALYGTVWGYVLFLGAAVTCGWLWGKAEEAATGYVGNALSAVISLLCIWAVFGRDAGAFFKPFGALGWVACLSVLSFLIQWLIRKQAWLVLGLGTGVIALALLGMYSLQLAL